MAAFARVTLPESASHAARARRTSIRGGLVVGSLACALGWPSKVGQVVDGGGAQHRLAGPIASLRYERWVLADDFGWPAAAYRRTRGSASAAATDRFGVERALTLAEARALLGTDQPADLPETRGQVLPLGLAIDALAGLALASLFLLWAARLSAERARRSPRPLARAARFALWPALVAYLLAYPLWRALDPPQDLLPLIPPRLALAGTIYAVAWGLVLLAILPPRRPRAD